MTINTIGGRAVRQEHSNAFDQGLIAALHDGVTTAVHSGRQHQLFLRQIELLPDFARHYARLVKPSANLRTARLVRTFSGSP